MTLDICDLTCGYGRRRVIVDLSLSIRPGECVALLGANGSGKSTLVKCVSGIVKPRLGSIHADGRDLLRTSLKERSTIVSYVPQATDTTSLSLTVHETVLQGFQGAGILPRRDVSTTLSDLLDRLGISDHAFRPVNELSGGERQRVFIARALARDTPYLLLDEPVSALDVRYQMLVMEILRDIAAEGKGVLTIVHDINLAMMYADRIVCLDGGAICYDEPTSLPLTTEIVRRIYDADVEIHQIGERSIMLPRVRERSQGCMD